LPFDAIFVPDAMRDAVSDRAWLEAMLQAELALARAQARVGLMPAEAVHEVAEACRPERFDLEAVAREARSAGNPVPALVAAAGSEWFHHGATSQDIVDSAAMLVSRAAIGLIATDLDGVAAACARLAQEHRETPMAGRTLMQQAEPTTFGLKAAGWLDAVLDARDELMSLTLAAQLGGAAGTLASLDPAGPEVLGQFAAELGLDEPVLAWHTIRTRPAELAGALGSAAGVIAKVARDVVLLAQTEVGEVREGVPGRGGSSTLPHKRNPVAAISAVAAAMRAPGLVAALLGAMAHEHERAAGPWQSEWRPFSELLEAVGSGAAWLRDCLEHLEVDAERMRANLDLTHGALLAERVTTALAPELGRHAAHELVREAAQEAFASARPLGDVLGERDAVIAHVERDALARLLDPADYLGATDELISRALRAHAERGAKPA
jgi:3-carboxy-cis,cis-muconate cycloisomerase